MNRGRPAAATTDRHTIDAALGLLACPVCDSPLGRFDRRLQCPSGHSFDLARQGHVNLLQGPAPRNADNAEMVAARDRFLDSGAYRPIRDAVIAACAGVTSAVEVGAGTGYYLSGVLATYRPDAHLALDVSVAAARRSAKAGLASAVADTWAGLPVLDAAVDRLLCVFAPRNPAEFGRILAPGGRAVLVTPSSSHLAGLRKRFGLLDVPADKLMRVDESFGAAGLRVIQRSQLEFGVTLSPPAVADLVGMGPNAFHQRPPALTEEILVQVAVTVSSFGIEDPVPPRGD